MQLSEKLDSIPREQTVQELDAMLDHASVSLSWYGQRLVSIEGFTGEVDMNQFVEKYLYAAPREHGTQNLKERLDHYKLWKKVKKLCKDSLNDTSWANKLVLTKEATYSFLTNKTILSKPIDFILGAPKEAPVFYPSKSWWCFSFHEADFKKLWPNEMPVEITLHGTKWVASKKMVETAYALGV